MSARRSKRQIDRLKKARSKRAGVVRARSKMASPTTRWSRRNPATGRITGNYKIIVSGGKPPLQPRPKLPLLSGGKDPTLAERFEEELLHY